MIINLYDIYCDSMILQVQIPAAPRSAFFGRFFYVFNSNLQGISRYNQYRS